MNITAEEIVSALEEDLTRRYDNLRIERRNLLVLTAQKGDAHVNLFVRSPVAGVATWRHVLNIRITGSTITAEPGYYTSSTPKIKQIDLDLACPTTFQQLYEFIEACGGTKRKQ